MKKRVTTYRIRTEMAAWRLIYLRLLRGKLHDHLSATELEPALQVDLQIIFAEVRRQLEQMPLLEYQQKLSSAGNRHNVFLVAITIAAYRAFVSLGVPESSAVNAIRTLGWELYAAQLRLVSYPWQLASRDPARRLHGTILSLLRFPFAHSTFPGYQVKVWREGSNLHTNWTSCAALNFVRFLTDRDGDNGELAMFNKTWCTYDRAGADLIADDGRIGHYQRTQTLSAGDEVCDMIWMAHPLANET